MFGLVALALLFGGCSVRKLAVNSLADSLSDFGRIFASDDDPELIGDALPFALKTIEALLAESPGHPGLLLAACQGFTQYGFAFVEVEAERLAFDDYFRSEALKDRARGLYLRGRDYCLESLEAIDPGIGARLLRAPETALGAAVDGHVDVVFWTGAAWGAAISTSLDEPEMVVDLPAVRALIARALEIDPHHGKGLVHDAMMTLEALPAAMGGSRIRAREHYDQSLALSGRGRAGTHVAWARTVAVQAQDRALFEDMLQQALAVDIEKLPDERLANRINQRRARVLLDQIDAFFFDAPAEDESDE